MRTPTRRRKTAGRPSQRGVALIMVLILLSLMMILGLAITMTGITEVSVSANSKLAAEAFTTADAGAVHAFEIVQHMNGDFTSLLRGSDGNLRTGDEFLQWHNAPY